MVTTRERSDNRQAADRRRAATPIGDVPIGLERALTEVGRAILRLEVPRHALDDGEHVDRAGYWLLVRISESGALRGSDLASAVELDPSTVSRQVRDLAGAGLIDRSPDPVDGRATLLSLSERGALVLESVREARRRALAVALDGWTEEERTELAASMARLAEGMTGRGSRP